jgi:hypothetical protein
MISVIIPALDDEKALIETLAALVEGVAEGVLRDCVVVSANPSELLERFADAAGCSMVVEPGKREDLIRCGAMLVRSDWSLVITPGLVPSGEWLMGLADWMADRPRTDEAAFIPFHAKRGLRAMLGAWVMNVTPRLTGRVNAVHGFVASTSVLRDGLLPRLAMTRIDARMVDRRAG